MNTMSNQLFYAHLIEDGFARFDEEESRHLVTVLRRKPGDRIDFSDGRGRLYQAELVEMGKKHALARVITHTDQLPRKARLHLAIAPTKQMERYEWMLEKAVEIGVSAITPLICKRSERAQLRMDRLEKVMLSAMKQSLRAWLPTLNQPTPFNGFVQGVSEQDRWIAWLPDSPPPHLRTVGASDRDTVVLIGPEGDFTPEEVQLAEQNGFKPVGLGDARLRTETAGVYVAAILS